MATTLVIVVVVVVLLYTQNVQRGLFKILKTIIRVLEKRVTKIVCLIAKKQEIALDEFLSPNLFQKFVNIRCVPNQTYIRIKVQILSIYQ